MKKLPMNRYTDSLERQLEPTLAVSLNEMQAIATVAKAGVTEMSRMHDYTASKFAITIEIAHHFVEAANSRQRLSPHQLAALKHLTETYLHEMLMVADETDSAIVDILLSR